MNELDVVKRKIKLARQGLMLSKAEIDELEFKYRPWTLMYGQPEQRVKL